MALNGRLAEAMMQRFGALLAKYEFGVIATADGNSVWQQASSANELKVQLAAPVPEE